MAAAEEDRRILVFIRQQGAEWRLVPADRHARRRGPGAAFEQRMEVVVKLFLEFRGGGKAVRGGGVALSVFGLEPSRYKLTHEIALTDPISYGFIVIKFPGDRHRLAIEQQFGNAALAGPGKRVLELPFRAGNWTSPRDRAAELVLGQRHAEPRPQEDDNDVSAARRRDVLRVLEVVRGDQRLALPQHRLDTKMIGKLPVQPGDDLLGLEPLRPHIGRRRNENPDCGQLIGHRPPRELPILSTVAEQAISFYRDSFEQPQSDVV
jgi:hypothetical protein